MDKDLLSIQEVRDLVLASKEAQKKYVNFTQKKIDEIIYEISMEIRKHSIKLAKMAYEETGFGKWEDKILKNDFASINCYEYIKNMKTVGILNHDEDLGIMEVGVPIGVVAGLIPSTNPTSTAIYKTLISLKSGNGIVLSPHPSAKNCIIETVEIMKAAAYRAGAPEGLIGVLTIPSMEGTSALMKHKDIGSILATGGEAMVRAAYSSGRPAIGVGPGNGPAFIERTADIEKAVKRIFDSKTFDNGVICASEQSIITEKIIKEEVMKEIKKQGGYFLSEVESKKLGKFILRANGTMNPQIVGKSAEKIADLVGIRIPVGTKILLSEQTEVSNKNPYAHEKLCPILAFFCEENWEDACEKSIEILMFEGKGHTLIIHSENQDVIKEFALKKPVSRLLVNTSGALGGIGATTNLSPALTLGCGAIGGSSTSDNVTPMNLINIRRIAWGKREIEDIRKNNKNDSIRKEDNIEDIEKMIRKVVKDILSK
ncbi:MAG: acetaldehyde dehydrogenase (acetylating) [Fusobacteriaceae bacterium]